MAEKEKLDFKKVMGQKATFKAIGTVVSITGEKCKKSKKSDWTGSSADITLSVNGVKQKIKVFGGVGASEWDIDVFLIDGENKFIKDGEGKSIKTKIHPSKFDPKQHFTFDKREVFEWGDRNAEGKATKIDHIVELSSGRFAESLLDNKELLIGKRVGVEGVINFKPNEKFDKLDSNIEPTKITIQKVEEGKTYNDMFLIQSPMIINKYNIKTMAKDSGFVGYVPVYHKYVKPISRDGKDIKGRNVYVPFSLTINKNGFLMLSESVGFSLEDRQEMLEKKIELKTQGAEFVVTQSLLNYKSGMIERDITVEELASDPVYGRFAKKALSIVDEEEKIKEIEKFKQMYKACNPATVKGEFKQQIDFLGITQTKEDGDVVFGISPEAFEISSLEKMKQESESTSANKQVDNYISPKIETKKGDVIPPPAEPEMSLDSFNLDDDEFPF